MKVFAYVISIITHPLLVLTYALLLMMYVNPFEFHANTFGRAVHINIGLVLNVFMLSFLYPAFAAGMMRALGMIDTIEMIDKQDRIGPYIATGICYLWLTINLYGDRSLLSIFSLGATIGLFMAFFINLFSKISMHTTGMGGLLGVAILLAPYTYGSTVGMIGIVAILAGLAGSARLLLDAHKQDEIYGGYLVGFVAQMVASKIIGLPV